LEELFPRHRTVSDRHVCYRFASYRTYL
jgi:hypothetical protein